MDNLHNLVRPQDSDTICALASASGTAGISVIRLSGPAAISICKTVCSFIPNTPESHRVYYGKLSDSESKELIDEVLVSFFEKGRSFTGEDTMEISTHGNPVLVSEVLRVLVLNGARIADRGEFSYRAFMNGRIDLVQAESILDLIESQTKKAAQLSLRQLEGQLSTKLKNIKNKLTRVLAHLEANIDFAAEDIEIESLQALKTQVFDAKTELFQLLKDQKSGRILRSGYQVVLLGQPNVGKSSLLNKLLDQEKSIVTDIPGTTRDLVDGIFTIDGYKVEITDTAGLRESKDQIEKIGQERAQGKVQDADLVFYVVDGSKAMDSEDLRLLSEIPREKVLVLLNKLDLGLDLSIQNSRLNEYPQLSVSAKDSQNLELIRQTILKRIHVETPVEESVVSLNSRHYRHLKSAEKFLGDSMTLMVNDPSPDLIALDLHAALREIYSVLGEVYDDQVMDQVFNQFCIGK